MTVGIYARISLDRRDGEGVARQLDDCRALAAERGWTEITEYVDNDISAFHGKKRPEYERLLDDVRSKRLSAVIAYHPDRLYRHPQDLEAFVDAVQGAGADVATVRAGDVDLATPSGRMVARILGAVSRQESERIGERVARAKRERATQGRHSGGGRRPYGLTEDRTAHHPTEAPVLREVADRILAGESWRQVVEWLNTAGHRNTSGREWTIGVLRRTLTSPHIAGLRAYHGEIIGPAVWEPVIDRDTWDLLRADVAGRRRGRPPSERHLLTGLLACSVCDRTLWATPTRTGAIAYRCSPAATTTGRGCGRISISGQRVETYVIGEVGGWLERPSFVAELDAYLAYGDTAAAGARAELDEIDRRQARLDDQWSSGVIDDARFERMSATLATRRTEVEARLIGTPRAATAGITARHLAVAWSAFTAAERREGIRVVARCPIPVSPAVVDGERVATEDRVGLVPVWVDGT